MCYFETILARHKPPLALAAAWFTTQVTFKDILAAKTLHGGSDDLGDLMPTMSLTSWKN